MEPGPVQLVGALAIPLVKLPPDVLGELFLRVLWGMRTVDEPMLFDKVGSLAAAYPPRELDELVRENLFENKIFSPTVLGRQKVYCAPEPVVGAGTGFGSVLSGTCSARLRAMTFFTVLAMRL